MTPHSQFPIVTVSDVPNQEVLLLPLASQLHRLTVSRPTYHYFLLCFPCNDLHFHQAGILAIPKTCFTPF